MKAIQILDLFTKDRPELTLTQIVALTGFSKTTAHGLLKTLLQANFLSRQGSAYRLGARLFEMGHLFAHQIDLRHMGLPHLAELAKVTQDTAHLLIVDNDTSLCLAMVKGKHAVQVLALIAGGRLPLHTGAAPTVLLAGMPEAEVRRIMAAQGFKRFTPKTIQTMDELMAKLELIRAEGYSLSWEDITPNVAAVGAPIVDYSGRVVAAVSVASILPRVGPDRLPFLIREVKKVAAAFSEELGGRPEAAGLSLAREAG